MVDQRSALKGAAALGSGAAAITAQLSGSGQRAAAQEKVKVRLSTWAGVDEAKELQAVIDTVSAAATTFEIVSEPNPADYYTRLQTTISGGNAADLFWLSQEFIAGYADRGALLDITDRLAADESPAAELDDYYPSVLQTAQYNGQTFGLPWISQPVILYYNPDLFSAAGVTPPDDTWTWDTFREAAAQLTNKDAGVYGSSFNDWPPIHLIMGVIGSLQTFTVAFFIDTPRRAGTFMNVHIYREAFQFNRMGYASSLGWVMLMMILLFTLLVFNSSPAWVHYEGEKAE